MRNTVLISKLGVSYIRVCCIRGETKTKWVFWMLPADSPFPLFRSSRWAFAPPDFSICGEEEQFSRKGSGRLFTRRARQKTEECEQIWRQWRKHEGHGCQAAKRSLCQIPGKQHQSQLVCFHGKWRKREMTSQETPLWNSFVWFQRFCISNISYHSITKKLPVEEIDSNWYF